MCGIFGLLSSRADISNRSHDWGAIARSMEHRGPDSQRIYRDDHAVLIHTRLSLVDLHERSDQPMWDASGRYCIVFNGELYGYQKVRQRLTDRGVEFRTNSDTEVLLNSVLTFGMENALAELDGMYAFAIYDRIEGSLLLARDRIGMKPLFVMRSGDDFVFASSVQALRALHPLEPDLLSVQSFLSGYGGPMTGRSFFKDVQILPPGTMGTILPGGRLQLRSFASWRDLNSDSRQSELRSKKPEQWVNELEALLLRSIESQMLADTPVGALCSGGVDSSLTLAMAKKFNPDLRVFHADVCGPLSELQAAKQVADHLDLPLNVAQVRDQDFLHLIPELTENYGFPFLYHPNAFPFLAVSKLVGSHGIKAVLCGEGADELFLGYEWLMPNIRRTLTRFPREVFRFSKERFNAWERKMRGKGPGNRRGQNDLQLVRSLPHAFEYELGVEDHSIDTDPLSSWPSLSDHRSLVHSGELSYILRTLMHRNDSLGMSASIETRYPLLDRDILRFGVNLPLSAKCRVTSQLTDWHHPFIRDKWVLRQVAARYLPKEIAHRVKRPFRTNALDRLQIQPEYFQRSILSEWFQVSSQRLRFMAEQASPHLRLRMLVLDVWGRLYFDGDTLEQSRSRLKQHVGFGSHGPVPTRLAWNASDAMVSAGTA